MRQDCRTVSPRLICAPVSVRVSPATFTLRAWRLTDDFSIRRRARACGIVPRADRNGANAQIATLLSGGSCDVGIRAAYRPIRHRLGGCFQTTACHDRPPDDTTAGSAPTRDRLW